MRLLLGDTGEKLKSIGPSGAAKVAGWRGEDVPGAGDEVDLHLPNNYLHLDTQVLGVATENRAKEVAYILKRLSESRSLESLQPVLHVGCSLEDSAAFTTPGRERGLVFNYTFLTFPALVHFGPELV